MISKHLKYKHYCKDNLSLVKNYDVAVKSQKSYHLHHILEFTLDGNNALSKEDLIRMDMYFNRPYFEFEFIEASVHLSMHNTTDKRRNSKIAKARIGKPLSEEHKAKLRKPKHRTPEQIAANKERFKGRRWSLKDGKRVWL